MLLLAVACGAPAAPPDAPPAEVATAPAVASPAASPVPAPATADATAPPAQAPDAPVADVAPQQEPARAAAPLSWPDPLPHSAPDVAALHKGLIAGSWPAGGPADFDRSWFDESALRVVFTGEPAGRRKWRGFGSASDEVPMDRLLDDREGGAIGYAYSLLSRVTPPEGLPDEAAVLHVRHRGRVRAWWDGQLVVDAPAPALGWSDTRVPVVLTGPYDVLLIKVARGPGLGASMDFSVRASAADGSALPGQAWKSMRPPGLPTDLPARADAASPDAPAPDGAAPGEGAGLQDVPAAPDGEWR